MRTGDERIAGRATEENGARFKPERGPTMDVDVLAKVRELQTEIGQGVDEAVLTDLLRAEGELEACGVRKNANPNKYPTR